MPDASVLRTLSITNETSQLREVRAFVAEVIRSGGIPGTMENGILLAVDEAVTNIITHAYAEGRRDTIEIEIRIDAASFRVVIRDSGLSFDPSEVSEPDIERSLATSQRHGLGIFLMRRFMDEVEYLFHEGIRNELRMVKYLGALRLPRDPGN